MQHGVTDEQLEVKFLASPEYISTHGGAGWVQGMYFDLLKRTSLLTTHPLTHSPRCLLQ
jgi:hypothetical protein